MDDVAPLGFSSLFTIVSEMSGEYKSGNYDLSGIFGLGPGDDFGILSCRDHNVQLFFLFEGAGTEQLPTFYDPFLHKAGVALLEAFRNCVPTNCGGIHHSEDVTVSNTIANVAIITHDPIGVTHLLPTHELQFLIGQDRISTPKTIEHEYGYAIRNSNVGQAIGHNIVSLTQRSSDIPAFWQGLRTQVSEFMAVPPISLGLIFGCAKPKSSDRKASARYACFISSQALTLRFIFGVPVEPSVSDALDGVLSLSQLRRQSWRVISC